MPRPLPAHVLARTGGGESGAVRDYILETAYQVIRQQGLAAASTRAIADEVGISGGTLYNYFGSHHELLAKAIVHRAGHLTDPVASLPSRAGTATVAGNLQYFVRHAAKVLGELVPAFAAAFSDPGLLGAVRREMAGVDPLNDPGRAVEHYLLAERDLGRISPGADCAAAAALIVSICHDDAFQHYLHGQETRPVSRHREIGFIARSLTA